MGKSLKPPASRLLITKWPLRLITSLSSMFLLHPTPAHCRRPRLDQYSHCPRQHKKSLIFGFVRKDWRQYVGVDHHNTREEGIRVVKSSRSSHCAPSHGHYPAEIFSTCALAAADFLLYLVIVEMTSYSSNEGRGLE